MAQAQRKTDGRTARIGVRKISRQPKATKVNTPHQALVLLRKKINADQRAYKYIAGRAGISPITLMNIVYGVTQSPHYRTVASILHRVYGINVVIRETD